jgi:hypothetical protein
MSKKKSFSKDNLGQIAWMLPTPEWDALVIGSGSIVKKYTLCNTSNSSVTVSMIELVHGDDNRIRIIGGSCSIGVVIAPRAFCTIEVEVNPHTIGIVKQVLSVVHNGLGSPLWIDILISISTKDKIKRKDSYLADDTQLMERQRRISEQEGHRRYARVHAREHANLDNPSLEYGLEGQAQNNILQNPWLNNQRFDGVDPNLNPEPPLNSEARREFDNERRQQDMEKQLRLGNVPRISPAPKPQGF